MNQAGEREKSIVIHGFKRSIRISSAGIGTCILPRVPL